MNAFSLFIQVRSIPILLTKDIEWKRDWFQNWSAVENRRKFMDEMKVKFKVEKPSDWGNVSLHSLREAGGSSLLSYYYNNSLIKCLREVYPGIWILHLNAKI